jgi:adenine-specific DNA-methyltransferase
MNEIFGEENFFTTIIVRSNKRGQTYKQISKQHEYILVYTKKPETEIKELEKKGDKDDLKFEDEISRFTTRGLRNRNPKFGRHNRPNLYFPIYVKPEDRDEYGFYPISLEKNSTYSVEVLPLNSKDEESCWRWGKEKIQENIGASTMSSNVVATQKNDGEFRVEEKYRKTTYKAKSIWLEKGVINEKGTVELGQLGLSDYFQFPKPVFLLKKLLMIGSGENDIILDFFAGSSPLAQAIYEQNSEDSLNRKFILVQLDEETPEDSPAKDMGMDTIADIGKERIRRYIGKISDEDQDQEELDLEERTEIDLGMKVFKLSSSNFKQWEEPESDDEEALMEQFKLFDSGLAEEASDEDVIYEVMLKEGYSLNSNISEVDCDSNKVYQVNDDEKDQVMLICLDDKITEDLLDELDLNAEIVFVCQDIALNDSLKVNLSMQTILKVI